MSTRREILVGGTVGSALAGLGLTACATPSAATAGAAAPDATPWLRRAFHMYTGKDGQSAIRALDLPAPQALASQWLLRRPAERVTMGSMAPGFMLDFHVANQPNILVPLFGTLLVKLRDGSVWSFGHGDILFAEDCSGGGHISGAGPEGCFSVSVQLPKTAHCLDPQAAPADVLAGRGEPRY
ncbi:MAG: hypothetical protein U1F11_11410 [Steroidobacteraceae bacterium]